MADLNVEFLPEAQQELAEAYDWYEERRAGLGDQLLLSVDAVLDAIQRHPESGPLVHREVRRLLTRRFPYSVLYVVTALALSSLRSTTATENLAAGQIVSDRDAMRSYVFAPGTTHVRRRPNVLSRSGRLSDLARGAPHLGGSSLGGVLQEGNR